ncbi:ATP-binding protein [Streptomyces sp. NPDC004393]|uniref:ATP-binding protein n=1 Tax=Streptomyces sp. NPDC004533 TaxID=3154278 RepID=UPI0033A407B6
MAGRVLHHAEPTQNCLVTLEWISRAENVVIAGPSGTGRSHFTEGVAQAAVEKDLRVAWFTLETLSAVIGKSKVDGSTARTVARICRAESQSADGRRRPAGRARLRHGRRLEERWEGGGNQILPLCLPYSSCREIRTD